MNITTLKYRIRNNQLIKDSFWSLLGNVMAKGLALVTGILVARFLGKDIYGEYGIIKNTIMAISVFSTFGLGYTATKYVAEYKNKNPQLIPVFLKYTTKITLMFSGVMALMVMMFANYIANEVLEAPQLNMALRLLAILIVFNAISITQIGVLAGFCEFKKLARINTIIGITTFIVSVSLTYFYKFNGALLSLLIVQILNCILNYLVVRKNVDKRLAKKSQKPILNEILKFSTPVALQEALYATTQWLCTLLLIKYASFGELGLYMAAMHWNSVILFIPGILRNVVLSHLSNLVEDRVKFLDTVKITILINLLVTLTLSIIVFLFGNDISNFYGISFKGLEKKISIASVIAIFASISNVYSQVYLSKGYNWPMFYFRLIRDFGVISLFIVFISFSKVSAENLLFSHLILNIAFLMLVSLFYSKYVKFK